MPLTPLALRPVEAHVTLQADEVLGSDLINLHLPSIRPDPFELCLLSALSAYAHGLPLTVWVDAACRGGSGRIWSPPFLGFHQSLAKHRPTPRVTEGHKEMVSRPHRAGIHGERGCFEHKLHRRGLRRPPGFHIAVARNGGLLRNHRRRFIASMIRALSSGTL